MAKQFRIACSGALSRVDTFIKSSSRNHSEASAKHNAQLEMCCSTVSLSSGVSRPSAHPIKASILRCRINTPRTYQQVGKKRRENTINLVDWNLFRRNLQFSRV